MTQNKEFQNIVQKFQYPSEFAMFLEQAYESFIDTFGIEAKQIIYEAFLNTEVVLCSNIYTYLEEENLLEEENETLVQKGDLQKASGVYQSIPEITYDSITGSYKITNIKRVVAIVENKWFPTTEKATLLHELSHLIKSYKNEYQIKDNILTERSGFIERKYILTHDKEKVTRKLQKEQGVGFEEGLTTVIEKNLTCQLVDPNYEVSGYGVIEILARRQLEEYGLKQELLKAQIMGQKEEFTKFYENHFYESAYTKLESIMDYIYKLSLAMLSNLGNREYLEQLNKEMDQTLKEVYWPFIDSIEESRKNSSGLF